MSKWLFLALVLLPAACTERAPQYPQRQPPAGFLESTEQWAAGEAIFRQNCAVCHGSTAEGRSPRANFFHPPASEFRDPAYRNMDPAYLYWRIETGKTVEPFLSNGSVMPAWGPYFSEEQIWQLVAYLRARSG